MLLKYVLVVQTCTVLVSSNMRQKRQFQFNLGQLFGPQPHNNNGQINNGQRIDLGAVAGNILGNILQRPKQTDGSSTPIPPLNGFINDFVGTALNNTDIQLGFENGNLQVAINPVNRPQENGRPDFNYDCDGQLFRRFPDRDRRRAEQVVCPCWRFGLIPDNNNLNIINNPSQENNPFSCKQKCDNTPECAAWTFKESRRRRNFNCFLKSSSANLFTVDDYVSGVKNCGQPGGQPQPQPTQPPQPQPTQAPSTSAPLTSCRTVSGANNGALCVLPFTHKGITHTKCTLDDADDGKPWCSTLTDGTGQHIGGQGQWGHCIPECSENQGLDIIPITEEKPAPGPVPGCGAYTKRFQTRIVGGKPADPNEWPWLAALLRPSSTGSGQYCGGTLISDTHVLTAAHCVVIFKTEEIQVKLGEYDFNAAGETQDQQYAVQSVIVHQQYNNATYENDIAILKLASPITRTKSVFPICFPKPNYVSELNLFSQSVSLNQIMFQN
ncbi:apolipoprotein(a) isoform X2 [Eurytemora carolleeae]|uniref:apolipoprotein(a) isoform X2 n=1 Tax=Eurytemora carolleeae TaxID=1294199 RepID=UPI000C77B460|nr:apolipoprotein(a) isoform X2 [Eurytemora carolleeae]|eukprot:XP_023328399.1 apolipoprotein(a)-like isoform X2 [Eurytemora affinis]